VNPPDRYWSTEAQRWIYPEAIPPLPEPDVKCGEYAGPPGEGANEDYYTAEQMHTYVIEAVLAERERCAKLCELMQDGHGHWKHGTPLDCANEIRKG
jgi:hypothetical protein